MLRTGEVRFMKLLLHKEPLKYIELLNYLHQTNRNPTKY